VTARPVYSFFFFLRKKGLNPKKKKKKKKEEEEDGRIVWNMMHVKRGKQKQRSPTFFLSFMLSSVQRRPVPSAHSSFFLHFLLPPLIFIFHFFHSFPPSYCQSRRTPNPAEHSVRALSLPLAGRRSLSQQSALRSPLSLLRCRILIP
jgi:hypothetical protein